MLVLGIESSCDETGVALFDDKKGLLSQALHSQIGLHQPFGGVVPEHASRNHIEQLVPLTDRVLKEAARQRGDIDAIAYTAGPGLTGALLTGACFAKSLAFALGIKALAVHHLEAHLLAAQLANPALDFPFIVLLVSGGHTQLLHAKALGDYQLLGDTRDDAVGEAFDKTAKLMGFPYPGGPLLAQLADNCPIDIQKTLKPFPRPMLNRPGLDFSFSGLKTHALGVWNNSEKNEHSQQAIAFHFQAAVIETLIIKCQRAMQTTAVSRLVVAGGVGANLSLRRHLMKVMADRVKGELFFPDIAYCTDNGAMVAYAGCLHLLQGERDKTASVEVRPRWSLESMMASKAY